MQIDWIRTNLSAIPKRTMRKLQKLCIRSRTKTIFAEKLFGNKKIIPHVVLVLYENNHSLIMQMQLLYEDFPESPWVSHFMVYTYHAATFFQSSVLRWKTLVTYQVLGRKQPETFRKCWWEPLVSNFNPLMQIVGVYKTLLPEPNYGLKRTE